MTLTKPTDPGWLGLIFQGHVKLNAERWDHRIFAVESLLLESHKQSWVGSAMHPCRGLGSTSPADILLNNHVMLAPANKWIIKSRPHKLVPEVHWTSWLPLRAVNWDKWVHGCGGHCVGQGMGHPGKPGSLSPSAFDFLCGCSCALPAQAQARVQCNFM